MRRYREKSIKFEGFEPPKDEQPQVFMKDGRPYDMNDPQFPIVRNHKFSDKYWAMPITDAARLRYIKEHWKYFNQTRFNNFLKEPTFVLLKDVNAWRMKLRGDWSDSLRRLRLSPNLFNSPHEGWVNRVLIHEMCHQYVCEKFGQSEKEQKGHGPLWRAAMMMAGLHPLRYDLESNETYTDPFEKEGKQRKIEKQDAFFNTYPQLGSGELQVGTSVAFMDNKFNIHYGLIFDYKLIKNNIYCGVITDVNPSTSSWIRWKVPYQRARKAPPDKAPNANDPAWAHAIKNAKKL